MELSPDYFLPCFSRALTYEKMGKREKALSDCRTSYKLNPDYWQTKNTLERLERSAKNETEYEVNK
jgi:hypothetical protein